MATVQKLADGNAASNKVRLCVHHPLLAASVHGSQWQWRLRPNQDWLSSYDEAGIGSSLCLADAGGMHGGGGGARLVPRSVVQLPRLRLDLASRQALPLRATDFLFQDLDDFGRWRLRVPASHAWLGQASHTARCAGVNWMSKQKTDAATILDSTACDARSKFFTFHNTIFKFSKKQFKKI